MTTRVLVVAHNHPDFHPGGTEIFAHDLFREYRSRPDVEALFLAATNQLHRDQRPVQAFSLLETLLMRSSCGAGISIDFT